MYTSVMSRSSVRLRRFIADSLNPSSSNNENVRRDALENGYADSFCSGLASMKRSTRLDCKLTKNNAEFGELAFGETAFGELVSC